MLPASPARASPARAGTAPFTIAMLPDTQIATQNHPEFFRAQTQWVADQRDALDVRFLVHVGDVVEWPSRRRDWQRARDAMALLDGRVPYAIALGNHDMDAWARGTYAGIAADRSAASFNWYFPQSLFAGMMSFADGFPAGTSDNTYHRFVAGGRDWLVITIAYDPTDAELAWAAGVVAAHPGSRVILTTHDYMNGVDRSAAGQRIWDAVAGRFANVVLVLAGHYTNQGYRVDTGRQGNSVHQVMADFQTYDEAACLENSYLRTLRIDPAAGTVEVRTYSPAAGRVQDRPGQPVHDLRLPVAPVDPHTATTEPVHCSVSSPPMTIRTDLSSGWRLRLAPDADMSAVPLDLRAGIPATVPGTVHTDLLAAGLIPDPYLDRNELALDWIGRAAWVYERDLDHEVVAGEQVAPRVRRAGHRRHGRRQRRRGRGARANMHRRYEVPMHRCPARRPQPALGAVRLRLAATREAERDPAGRPARPVPRAVQLHAQDGLQLRLGLGSDAGHGRHLAPGRAAVAGTPARLAEVRPLVTRRRRALGASTFDVRLDRAAARCR